MSDVWADAQALGVAVLDPASYSSDGDAYTVAGVSRPVPSGPPLVSGLDPATLAVGDEPQEVAVQGSDFTRDCRVMFGGATPPTNFHSDSELAVRVEPGDWQPGTVQVFVAYSSRGPSAMVPFIWT